MRTFFEKTWLVFLVSMLIGLAFPGYAYAVEPFLVYLLMIMVALSIRDIPLRDIFGSGLKNTLILFLANYLLLSLLIVVLSLFLDNPEYQKGFIVMAAVPCAIAVVPFAKLLKGDIKVSTYGLIFTYLVSLFLTPMIIWLFFRESIDLTELLKTIFLLIIVPMLLAIPLRRISRRLEKHDTVIINVLFLITIYGFIGLNRETIVNDFFSLGLVMLLLFVRTFGIMTLVYFAHRKLSKDRKFTVSLTLFSSYKNLGYAALLALALFGREAALPATLGILFELLAFIYLERLVRI
jgi:bile acid:Na+ symporter, BASS family